MILTLGTARTRYVLALLLTLLFMCWVSNVQNEAIERRDALIDFLVAVIEICVETPPRIIQ